MKKIVSFFNVTNIVNITTFSWQNDSLHTYSSEKTCYISVIIKVSSGLKMSGKNLVEYLLTLK